MSAPWIEIKLLKTRLADFFNQNKKSLSTFGNTVNQTFEAYVFASVIGWYRESGWTALINSPIDKETKKPEFRLKFSTRGRPSNYSFAQCKKGLETIQIRHQLRVATFFHNSRNKYSANVCLDVAVINDTDLGLYLTNTALPNANLITFGEAKHMSGFAELVAGFIGLVHELQPRRLKRIRTRTWKAVVPDHLSPFLFVSGILYPTGQGIHQTIQNRLYDINIFTQTDTLPGAPKLPAEIK